MGLNNLNLGDKVWVIILAALMMNLTACESDSEDTSCEVLDTCDIDGDGDGLTSAFSGTAVFQPRSNTSDVDSSSPAYNEWPSDVVTGETGLNDGLCAGAAKGVSYMGNSNDASLSFNNLQLKNINDGDGINVCELPQTLDDDLTLSPYSIYILPSEGTTVTNDSIFVIPKGALVLAERHAELIIESGSVLHTGPESFLVDATDAAFLDSTVFHSMAWAESVSGDETPGYWQGIVNRGDKCLTFPSGDTQINCRADILNTAIFGASDAIMFSGGEFTVNSLLIKNAYNKALVLEKGATVKMDYSVIDQSGVIQSESLGQYVIEAAGMTATNGVGEAYIDPNDDNGQLTMSHVIVLGHSESDAPILSLQRGMKAEIADSKMVGFENSSIEIVDRATLENGVADSSTGVVSWFDTYNRIDISRTVIKGSNNSLKLLNLEQDENDENAYATEADAEAALEAWYDGLAGGLIFDQD